MKSQYNFTGHIRFFYGRVSVGHFLRFIASLLLLLPLHSWAAPVSFVQTDWGFGVVLTVGDCTTDGSDPDIDALQTGVWSAGLGECLATDAGGNQTGWIAHSNKHANLSIIPVVANDSTLELATTSDSVTHTTFDDFGPIASVTSTTHQSQSDFTVGASPTDIEVSVAGVVRLAVTSRSPAWTEEVTWDTGDLGAWSAPALAQFMDDDGTFDMFVGRSGDSRYYRNLSPGWGFVAAGPDKGSYHTPGLADLNGDGLVDMILGQSNGYLYGYRNTGDKTSPVWTAEAAWNGPYIGAGQNTTPALADLDGDGDNDLLTGKDDGTTLAYENTDPLQGGSGSLGPDWQPAPASWNVPDIGGWSQPAIADLDGDGDFDLLVGGSDGLSDAYENTDPLQGGSGSSGPVWAARPAWDLSMALDKGAQSQAAPTFADLDGDGDEDLMVGVGSGHIYGYKNTGSSNYVATGTLTSKVIDTGVHGYFTTLDYSSTVPPGATLTIAVRAGDTPNGIGASWTDFTALPNVANGGDISSLASRPYVQYRITMTGDTTDSPTVSSITFNYFNFPDGSNITVLEEGSVSLDLAYTPVTQLSGSATSGIFQDSFFDMEFARSGANEYVFVSEPSNKTTMGNQNTNGNDHLMVVDVTNPLAPVRIARALLTSDPSGVVNRVYGLDVVGDPAIAYVAADNKGLAIVSSPYTSALVFYDGTDGRAQDVHVDGGFAYVADATFINSNTGATFGGGVYVYDISTPDATPRLPLFSYEMTTGSGTLGIAKSGDHIYFANGDGGLLIFKVDPLNPIAPITLLHTIAGTANYVTVDGNYAYVTTTSGGSLKIYDLSVMTDSTPPSVISTFTGFTGDVDIANGHAYAAGSRQVLNIRDPANPQLVATFTGNSGTVNSNGKYVYVGESYASIPGYNTNRLRVMDMGPFLTPGDYMPRVMDLGEHVGLTTLSFTTDAPGASAITIDMRAGDTSSPGDGSWTNWQNGIASGTDIGALFLTNTGSKTYRYVQYRANLTSDATTLYLEKTPKLEEITVNYTRLEFSAWLESSFYDTGNATGVIDGISWAESLPADTDVQLQIRTAPDNAGDPGTWSSWMGPDGSADSYWNSANTYAGDCSGSGSIACTFSPSLRDGINDQWFQYRATLTSTAGVTSTPQLFDVTIDYDTSTTATGSTTITISPATPLTTSEAGTAAVFDVTLSGTAPSADVTIDFYTSDVTEGIVSPATTSLTFPVATWNQTRQVTVIGQDDFDDDGDIAYSFASGATRSADSAWNNVDVVPGSFTITNLDDDDSIVLVNTISMVDPVAVGLLTNEAGTIDSFEVALGSMPTSDVDVTINGVDSTEHIVWPVVLTFTPGNWNIKQQVDVLGVDDPLIDNDQVYFLSVDASGGDPDFNGETAAVKVTNEDDDVPGIIAVPSTLTTSESGGSVVFTMTLTSQPAADVSFSLSSSDTSEGDLSFFGRDFTFIAADWDQPQAATLFGVADGIDEVAASTDYSIITTAFSSADPVWNGFDPADIPATNIDVNNPTVNIIPPGSLVTSEDGGSVQFAVTLGATPSSDVTVSFGIDNASEAVLMPPNVTFSPADIPTHAKFVTVTGIDDRVNDGDSTYTLTPTMVTTDADFLAEPSNLSLSAYTLTNLDNGDGVNSLISSGVGASWFGHSVATGDINNDGKQDLIVGSYAESGNSGKVYVYFGTASGYSATPDWSVVGNAGSSFGYSVAAADVNNDNFDDVIIGAYTELNDLSNEGRVYAFYSSAGVLPPDTNCSAAGDGLVHACEASWIAEGDMMNSSFGFSIANAGDFNGDNIDDIVIGQPNYTNGTSNEGAVYVYYGSSPGGLVTSDNCAALGDGIVHASCQTQWMTESNINNASLGYSVARAGDMNSATDNIDDIIVGARYAHYWTTSGGAGFVYYGGGDTAPDWTVHSSRASTYLGVDVAGVGDINDDGNDDVMISSYSWYANGANYGGAYVFHGSPTGLAVDDACELWPANGFAEPCTANTTIQGNTVGMRIGNSIASLDDYNSDGVNDVIIGSVAYTNGQSAEGVAQVFYGQAGSGLGTSPDLSFESNQINANLGSEVGSLGDLNSDGLTDFFIGAGSYTDTVADDGAVFIYLSNAPAVGITPTPATGLVTTELGATDTFTVVLDSPPMANVTINVASNTPGEGTASPTSLTFTSFNWKIPQTVTVTGVDDGSSVDGDTAYKVVLTPSSGDFAYNALLPVEVDITNLDNDISPLVSITATNASINEAGASDFVFSRLSDVTSSLTVYYTVSGSMTAGTDYVALSGSVDIAAGSASVALPLQLINDSINEGTESITVTLSADAAYTIDTPSNTTVTVSDNDPVGLATNRLFGLLTHEAAGSDSFTVALRSQPTADVDVTISSDNTAEGEVLPTTPLTFTSSNWQSPRTVTVIGQDDLIADGDVDYNILLNTSSADPKYDLLSLSISATNKDDENVSEISVLASTAAVGENSGGIGVFTVTRSGDTSGELRVFYTIGGSARSNIDYIDLGTIATILPGNSSVDIPVSPINDSVGEADETIIMTLALGSKYLLGTPSSDTVRIIDDDAVSLPVANFVIDQAVAEGTLVTVNAYLSSPTTSTVTIPYTVTGTATGAVDHDAVDGSIVINSGSSGSTTFNALTDVVSDNGETVIFTMGTLSNARPGTRGRHVVTINDENVQPAVALMATQAGLDAHLITTGGGNVTVTATVTDINAADAHSYDWSASNAGLVDIDDADPTTFVFDPGPSGSNLTNGNHYAVRLTVTDDGAPALATSIDLQLEVNTAPPLTTDDSDNDGFADNVESYDDEDGDGIADYLDADTLLPHELQMYATQSETYIIRTEPGLTLKLGETALAAGSDGALVTADEIIAYGGGEGQPGANSTDTVASSGGYFDFEISGLLAAGQSVRIVLPQLEPLPVDAVYRKYNPVTGAIPAGWRDYGLDNDNQIFSAPGAPGICPLPGDPAYVPGLIGGYYCVQLVIQDGGPNDMDNPGNPNGLVNYVIKDPAHLGVMASSSGNNSENDEITINITGTGGGGVISLGFLAVVLLYILGVSQRRSVFMVVRRRRD